MEQKRRAKKNPKMARASSQKPQQKHATDLDLSPEVEKQLQIAKEVMEEHHETLEILGKM